LYVLQKISLQARKKFVGSLQNKILKIKKSRKIDRRQKNFFGKKKLSFKSLSLKNKITGQPSHGLDRNNIFVNNGWTGRCIIRNARGGKQW
jgi:hypothetical protein